jgi:hypothetical protein
VYCQTLPLVPVRRPIWKPVQLHQISRLTGFQVLLSRRCLVPIPRRYRTFRTPLAEITWPPHISWRSWAESYLRPSPGYPRTIATTFSSSQGGSWLGILGLRRSLSRRISSPCRSTGPLQR